MITSISDKFQMKNNEFDLGPEWQLDEIELFLKRLIRRFSKAYVRQY